MNPLTTRSRRSASLAPSIEPLETRIAPAAVVSLTAGDLSVIDGVDLADTISISTNGVNFQFNDPTGITAGAGATQIDPNNVEVPVASVTGSFTVMTNGGDDFIGFSGPIAFPGALIVNGGSGQDFIAVPGTLAIGGDATLTSTGGIGFDTGVAMAPGTSLTVDAGDTITLGAPGGMLSASGVGSISLTTAKNIVVMPGWSVMTANGDITLSANASQSAVGDFVGISIDGSSVTATGGGIVSLTGTGGSMNPAQIGVAILNGGTISGGSGPGIHTIVNGFGGNVAGGGNDKGVLLDSGTITSSGGDVSVLGAAAGPHRLEADGAQH